MPFIYIEFNFFVRSYSNYYYWFLLARTNEQNKYKLQAIDEQITASGAENIDNTQNTKNENMFIE